MWSNLERVKLLIIHNQEGAATEELLQILQKEEGHNVGGVFHFFIGNSDTAKKIIDQGFYISFAGNVTYREESEMHKVVKEIPFDKFLIETDAPFAAPEPYRRQPNYPGYIIKTAECIAKIRGISIQEVAETTARNFEKLFGVSIMENC